MGWIILLVVAVIVVYYFRYVNAQDVYKATVARNTTQEARPGNAFKFRVAGVEYNNRKNIIAEYCKPGVELMLIHEKKNKYDVNAIGVWTINPKRKLGFVPKKLNTQILPHLNSNVFRCYIDDVSLLTESEIWGKSEDDFGNGKEQYYLNVDVIVELKSFHIPSK